MINIRTDFHPTLENDMPSFVRFFAIFSLFICLFGCSATKKDFFYVKSDLIPAEEATEKQGPGSPTFKKARKVDNREPANFEEYREWRKANDPSGQTYAEYKKWESAYRKWSQAKPEELKKEP